MSYCKFTKDLDENHPDKRYHDKRYGFPVEDDNELFGRLILEINQAGLNWSLILKKEENFKKSFNQFSVHEIAQFDEEKVEELMQNKGIVRNRRKIEAIIHNANQVKALQHEMGSFKNWLDLHHTKTLDEWTKLFKKTFKFTGEKIVEEFLMSTGYLKGAHDESCKIYKEIIKFNPKWLEKVS